MKMLNLIFNAFGITLTAAAVYGAMEGQIFVPIGFAVAAVAVALLANFVEARGI
jgi:NADH:ubiquinone oxidoreductase subunit K